MTDVPTGIALTNADTRDSTVLVGVTTSLKIEIVNNSGAGIPLTTGAGAPAFGVYLPSPKFFTPGQLQAIKVTADGWTGSPLASDLAINITCSRAGTWAAGATLTFTLTGVISSGPPGTDSATVIPSGFDGDVAITLEAPLAVASAPEPGNLKLPDVLQVTLDSQGSVLRSASTDPLANTLYLTLKNTGATPLATGNPRAGNPQAFVSFVYGNTSGALAPDSYDPAKGPQTGSAWNITAGIASAQSPWTAANPRPGGEDPHPQWVLTPSPNNLQILGPAGGDQANVTFAFSNLVSITPTGHTQMLVLCTGFAKDAQTMYDDHLFVLDIVKVDAPATRGLLSFFGPEPLIPVTDPNAQVTIPLRWTIFDVASVQLLTSSPAVAPVRKTYAIPPKPIDYDNTSLTLSAPQTSEAIFVTLQAFDAGGGYLNSQQFTAYMEVSYVIDGTGNVYPIALFGSTFWMLENYRYPAAGQLRLRRRSRQRGHLRTALQRAGAAPRGMVAAHRRGLDRAVQRLRRCQRGLHRADRRGQDRLRGPARWPAGRLRRLQLDVPVRLLLGVARQRVRTVQWRQRPGQRRHADLRPADRAVRALHPPCLNPSCPGHGPPDGG